MRLLDRIFQRWRIAKAGRYIFPGARVLDIGCGDGALFRCLDSIITEGWGIDPDLQRSLDRTRWKLIAGRFPRDLPEELAFDVITMLAVLEHIPPDKQSEFAVACARRLRAGGHLIITVPSPRVDRILWFLRGLRVIDARSLEEHYGFDPNDTPSLFSTAGLTLLVGKKFQLGLNNLFVFKQAGSDSMPVPQQYGR